MNKLISLVQLEIALKRAGIAVTEEQLETLKQSLFTPQVGEKWEMNNKVCTVEMTDVYVTNGDKSVPLIMVADPEGKHIVYTPSAFESSRMISKA